MLILFGTLLTTGAEDTFTGSLEETILTEVIPTALDSGASRVTLVTDAAMATLTIIDNDRGMQRRELARYHDIAASTRRRGEGIGFAGGGACPGDGQGHTRPGVSICPQMMSYLGFKLESTHGPVDTIDIDRVERPDDN